MNLFDIILFRPIINALVILYNIPGVNFGLAIIVLTIIIKTGLYPLTKKSVKMQKAMGVISPKIKEIQKQHKDDKQKQAQALTDLYREHKVNPLSGCLPLLIQLPILIGLYRVLLHAFEADKLNYLYYFVSRPESLNPSFFGVLILDQPNIYMAFITGAIQLIYSLMVKPKKSSSQDNKGFDFSSVLTTQMTYVFPVITVFILIKFPAGLALYWLTMTLYSIFEYKFIKKPQYEKNNQNTQ